MKRASIIIRVLLLTGMPALFLACGRPEFSEPTGRRTERIIEWSSPYISEPVEESPDGKWEEFGNHPGIYRALLAGRVTIAEEGPQASATRGGKEVPLRPFTSVESLKPGDVMIVPEARYEVNLSSPLTNNGKVNCSVVLLGAPVRIMVTAKGKSAVGVAPHMLLHWNGEVVKEFDVAATRYEPYVATAEARDGTNVLEIEFNNDYWKPPEDRNLYLGHVELSQQGSVIVKVEAPDEGPPRDFRIKYRPQRPIVDRYRSDEPAPGLSMGEPWRYYVAGNETRPAIPLPPPGKVAFDVPGPWEEIVLSFSLIRTEPEWRDETTTFEIAYESSGKTSDCGKVVLAPKTRIEDQAWVELRVRRDLEGAKGKPGSLVITTWRSGVGSHENGDSEFGHHLPLVGQPIVLGRLRAGHEPRNVILVSLDTLRGDHLSSLGYHRDTSPHLDRFGEDNFNFVKTVAQASWTLPSHITMLTSLYPSTHGVFLENESVRNVETVASIMRQWGYQTKAIVDGGYLSPEFGLCFGFDSYEDHDYTGFSEVMPAAERWLRANRDRPFFLFLHTYDTHAPYRSPEEYRGLFPIPEGVSPTLLNGIPGNFVFLRETVERATRNPVSRADLEYLINVYDAAIRYVDDQMQVLFELLKELGLWDNTLIIVTSDHGEKFLERGELGHKDTLYEEITHVPLMVRAPGLKGLGAIDTVVEVIDIAPTILDWAGIRTSVISQGDSLLPILRGASWTNRPAFSEELATVACRTRNWKFIRQEDLTESWELYDLDKDPGEKANLASEMPDPVAQMDQAAQNFRKRNLDLGKDLAPESMELSEGLSVELSNLGYLGR